MSPRYCWPTTEQWLLLRAALLQGPDAIRAWREWRERVDPDALGTASSALLPLLCRNVRAHGSDDPPPAWMRDLRRRAWAENADRLNALAALLRLLHAEGIETLVLKGAALVVAYYPDLGLRSMSDVDVLVPRVRVGAAMARLREEGWRPVGRSARSRTPEMTIAVSHAHAFTGPSGQQLDLHWHVFPECCDADADLDFWADARTIEIDGVTTRMLSPTDQLLHVCVHGTRWSHVQPVRWVADAMMVLARERIDWDRLVGQAGRRGLVCPIRDTLRLLSEMLGAPIPAAVLVTLRDARVTAFERVEYALQTRAPGLLGTLPVLVCHHWRRTRAGGLWKSLAALPGLVKSAYEIERWAMVPALLVETLARRRVGDAGGEGTPSTRVAAP